MRNKIHRCSGVLTTFLPQLGLVASVAPELRLQAKTSGFAGEESQGFKVFPVLVSGEVEKETPLFPQVFQSPKFQVNRGVNILQTKNSQPLQFITLVLNLRRSRSSYSSSFAALSSCSSAGNSRMASVALFILSVLAHLVVLHSAEYSEAEPSKHCPGHFCSDIAGNISFPFKSPGDPPECGLFTVDCSEPDRPKIQLKEGGYWHEFQGSLFSPSISINDRDLADRLEKDRCDDGVFDDLSLPSASPIVEVPLFTHDLTLFKCNTTLDKNSYPQLNYGCGNANHTYYTASFSSSLTNPPPPGCATIQVPIVPSPSQPITLSSLTAEFSLEVEARKCYQCRERKGECLVEYGNYKCAAREKGDKQVKLKLGLGKIDISTFKISNWYAYSSRTIGAASVIVVLVVVCCFFWKKRIQKHQIMNESTQ
ncbi:hypothetical protein DVH24_007452 [Malus domestica]|uniref:Wall-associated receptor kinase galacturonan-binding domain-containing protein n=1 Tax=Malus domestica TaxID=3750 RepID=A0A498HFE7_MALDO|nr:hypothetical protein DVH24_007452 [Malus domestica]